VKLNLGCGLKSLPKEDGWVNVDRQPLEGVDRVMDLFRYPFDFEDNSVDEFYISHLIEHIPHEAKRAIVDIGRSDAADKRWHELKDLDGFFAFFAEVWRIGKNGAKVEITCPFGLTYGALQDPTHTRIIVPQTLAYLTEEMHNNRDFNYNLPFLFTVKNIRFEILGKMKEEELRAVLDNEWNRTRNMYAGLEIIK
jgi:hypothetical protein